MFRTMLVLASSSPRRRELMALVTEDYIIDCEDTDETLEKPFSTSEPVKLISERKAAAVFKRRSDDIVIGADTVVAAEGRIYGKPKDEQDAEMMLAELSGKEHEVLTGVCVLGPGIRISFVCTTKVRFKPLTKKMITEYVRTGEPMDKAGAYAIQGGASEFVESFDGDWNNIVGLPVDMLRSELESRKLI